MARTAARRPARTKRRTAAADPLAWRGFLLHMTHYDPRWNPHKKTERRYDKATARAIIRRLAERGFNLLLIDVKDSVLYRGLPDIRRRYSAPMAELAELADYARSLGLEVVPKLNFARSPVHRHSAWLDDGQRDPDSAAFWRRGFAAIDEVVRAVRPSIVHVGMDEDDTRSPQEYLDALMELYRGLKRRKLRMMMWAEVGHNWRPQQRWKEVPALEALPRDVILAPWSYGYAQDEWTRRLKRWGFAVVGACGYGSGAETNGADPLDNARDWVRVARAARAEGVILTKWIKCSRANRAALLAAIDAVGPVLAQA